jgi:hypothetical protein
MYIAILVRYIVVLRIFFSEENYICGEYRGTLHMANSLWLWCHCGPKNTTNKVDNFGRNMPEGLSHKVSALTRTREAAWPYKASHSGE